MPIIDRDTRFSSGHQLLVTVYHPSVSEQGDVVGDLADLGVLAAIRWAYAAACARTLGDFDEADGHDATWFGTTRHTLFRDRLDRVFHCERYAAQEGTEGDNLDLVFERLSQDEIDTFPALTSMLVARADLQGSPGWSTGTYRFLIASTSYGEVETLPWPRKSETKQMVAAQRGLEPQPTLFDDFADDEVGSLRVLEATAGAELDVQTFVVAHSLDPVSGERELVFGRPFLNLGGGNAWRWREDLLRDLPSGGAPTTAPVLPSSPDAEPDAAVRLRRGVERRARGGEQ